MEQLFHALQDLPRLHNSSMADSECSGRAKSHCFLYVRGSHDSTLFGSLRHGFLSPMVHIASSYKSSEQAE